MLLYWSVELEVINHVMSIMSHISLARLFKNAYKPTSDLSHLPDSAKRAIARSNQPRPFTIDRDVQGTRPWYSYAPGKPKNNS